jgi:hypothetical protein
VVKESLNKEGVEMKSKNGVLQFMSGFIFMVLAIIVLQNGLKGVFTGSSRWVVGIGFIIIGSLNIYESEFWKPKAHKPIKEAKGFWNKVKVFLLNY